MKNNNAMKFLSALFTVALLGAGCPLINGSQPPPTRTGQPTLPATSTIDVPADPTNDSDRSTFVPFTKTAYDEARAAGKPIFLFFYANWCPTCREQEPRLQRVVPTHMGGVAGFRVNYNDNETDADEKALAAQFGVTYQHTGFFIGADGQVKKKTIGTFSDAQTLEYLDLIAP